MLRLFGFAPPASAPASLPYSLRDDFLSPAERSFDGVLVAILSPGYVVCPKVNVADILFVARPNENRGALNRIDRKHVDSLVCEAATMKPRCAVGWNGIPCPEAQP